MFLFCTASFDYYLIGFYMKYIPGNIFVNTIMSSVAECIATFTTGCIVKCAGPRNSMIQALCLSAVSVTLLSIAQAKGILNAIPVLILLGKFGVS